VRERISLTQQEILILQALAAGAKSHEIAAAVNRSRPTVEAAVRLLLAKFNATSRAHLVARAIVYGAIASYGRKEIS
jgi:DNA-binding NarL/FixJ family response regulator